MDYVRFVDNPNNPLADPSLPDEVPLGDLRFFDFSPGGAVDVTLDALPEFNGDGTPWDSGTIPFVGPFYGQGGDGSLVADFNSDLMPDEDRYSLSGLFDYEVSESLSVFTELHYTNAPKQTYDLMHISFTNTCERFSCCTYLFSLNLPFNTCNSKPGRLSSWKNLPKLLLLTFSFLCLEGSFFMY